MAHPVIRSPSGIIIYVISWGIFIIAQVSVLFYFYDFPLRYAIWDASVYFILYSSLGLVLWYPVSFIYLTQSSVYSKIVNFLGLGAGSIILWQLLGASILRLVLKGYDDLIEFNQLAMPARLLAGVLIFMILSLFYYLIIFYTSLEDKKLAEAELKSRARESELTMLKYQINPHFLFNSLNSINSLTISNPEKARDMIVKLSSYLRYSLQSDHEHFNVLKDEIANIRRYLEIEKTRFGERINYEELVDAACEKEKVPSMILQPLFENAIKHGVHESTGPVLIRLKCYSSATFLKIEVQNSIVKSRKSIKGTGTGLSNVGNRLYSAYGEENLMEVVADAEYFIVRLKIPLYL